MEAENKEFSITSFIFTVSHVYQQTVKLSREYMKKNAHTHTQSEVRGKEISESKCENRQCKSQSNLCTASIVFVGPA